MDISDQRDPAGSVPDNFRLILYDGYELDEVDDDSVDICFSDQLIEHLHPDDTRFHFETVKRILRPGGKYVFRTPHAMSGPFDVSMFFSDEAQCFHLKEWTYTEMRSLLDEVGFSPFHTYWQARRTKVRLPYPYFATCEWVLRRMPGRSRRTAARFLIPNLCGVAVK